MTATLTRRRRTKSPNPTGRPVQQILLELAYRMHATRVVGRRPEPAGPSPAAGGQAR